ncbi:MAG: hypothetical protein AAF414_10170 [Pseudomonadota bacterium]
MGYGLYDYDRRYRRRLWGTITRVGFYLVTVGIVGLFAYQIGVEQIEGREERFVDRIETLEAANETLTDNAVRLQAQARTALVQYQQMRQLYDRDLPTGIRNELLTLIDERLESGVTPDRIALYLEAATQPQDCSEPVTRRFIMPTPNYTGSGTSVGFGEGLVTVTGRGQNAAAEDGSALSWFDPGQEVTMIFNTIGGDQQMVSGVLPVFHAMVVGAEEFRFAVEEGDRSLVNVSADRCPLVQAVGSSP